MTHVDTDFLTRSKAVFLTEERLTLADVKRLTEADPGLNATQRRDLVSALNRVRQLFQMSLDQVEASPQRVRELFAAKSATQLNLSDKTFANLRSLVVQALDRYAAPDLPLTRRIPLAPCWRDLLDRIELAYQRQALYRLASYCTVMGTVPDAVSTQTLLGLYQAITAEEVVKNPRNLIKNTISNWNRSGRSVPGWPQLRLSSPFKTEAFAWPLSAFPLSFQEDVRGWRERMADPDPLDEEAPARALRSATIDHRIYNFRQFASALVHTGRLPVEAITSLTVLFAPEHFKAALRVFLDRSGKTQRIHNLARSLRLIAKHYCRMDEPTLAALEAICKRLDPGTRRQMTARNRQRLGQFDDPRHVARLLRFPEQEVRWTQAQTNPLRAAKGMERAVAVSLLIHCGLRIGSLRTLELTDFT